MPTKSTTDHTEDDVEPPQARVYRTLGTVYLARPTEQLAQQIRSWADVWLQETPAPTDEIAAALEQIRTDSTPVDELRPEFTRLFRGVSERSSVEPPYESLYRDGQLYGSTAIEVQQGYRSAGFEVTTDDENELPDHLGIELQFLGELCEMRERDEGLPAERVDDAIQWLLDEHLTEWLPQVQVRIHEADPSAFYAGVVDLTAAVVDEHHQRVVNQDKPEQ